MTFSLFAEIFVCVLAVFGVYYIFRDFVAWCLPRKHISLGVHATCDKSEYELYLELREAALISESNSDSFRPPVLLVDYELSQKELEKLNETGAPVYVFYRGKSEQYR